MRRLFVQGARLVIIELRPIRSVSEQYFHVSCLIEVVQ